MKRYSVSFTIDSPSEKALRDWFWAVEFNEEAPPIAEDNYGDRKPLNIHDLKVEKVD